MPPRKVLLAPCLLLFLAFAPTVDGQQVKLKDKGVKGTLTSATCTTASSCTVVDLSVAAPDRFLYITQICMAEINGAVTDVVVNVNLAPMLTTNLAAYDTDCFAFDPAFVASKNSSVFCLEQGSSVVACSVTGVLSKK